jgi:hypothetical protein
VYNSINERAKEIIKMKIWFDMDGTIADLYAVEGWLAMLENSDPTPYEMAKPLLKMNILAHQIHALQRRGHQVGIISWCSKSGTEEYNKAVRQAKLAWLAKHLPSVEWDAIEIVSYGQNKWNTCKEGILFDDEARNRDAWLNEQAYEPCYIHQILARLNH